MSVARVRLNPARQPIRGVALLAIYGVGGGMVMPRDMTTDPTDEALLALYAAGNAEAARLLAQRLLPRVLAYARRMLGGDQAEAEDVGQEAMLRLWRAAPGWRSGEAQVSTWLYRVVANLVIDRLRSRRRRGAQVPIEVAPDIEDGGPSAEAMLLQGDRMQALDAAMAQLPERQREAVALRHLEALSNPEIAEIMNIGVEAVESLVARGKRALTAALQGRRAEFGFEME